MAQTEMLSLVFKFLFIPEQLLAWIFLVVFIILFCFGIYLICRCKSFLQELDTIAEEYYSIKDKLTPKQYVARKIENISPKEAFIESIPNIMVTIGIFATFIGLGIAIKNAAELLGNDKFEISQLNNVLSLIAFKFQTSVWGIFFSLLFQVAINWYQSYRQRILDNVEDALYNKYTVGVLELLEQQVNSIGKLREEEKEYSTSRKEENDNLIKDISQYNQNRANQNSTLFTNLSETIIQEQTTNHDLIRKFNDVVAINQNGIQELIKELTTTVIQQQDINRELVQKLINEIVNLRETNHADAEGIKQAVVQSTETMQKCSAEQKASLVEVVAISKIISDFAEKVDCYGSKVANTATSVDSSVAEINRQLDTVNNQILYYHETCLDLAYNFKKGMQEMQQKFINGENEYIKRTQKEFSDILRSSLKEISDKYIDASANLGKSIGELDELLKGVKGQVEATKMQIEETQNGFAKMQNSFSATTKESFSRFDKTIDNFEDMISTAKEDRSKNHDLIVNLCQGINNTFTEMYTKQKDSNKKFVQDGVNAINKISDLVESRQNTMEEQLTKSLDSQREGTVIALDKVAAEVSEAIKQMTIVQKQVEEDFKQISIDVKKNILEAQTNANNAFADAQNKGFNKLVESLDNNVKQTEAISKEQREETALKFNQVVEDISGVVQKMQEQHNKVQESILQIGNKLLESQQVAYKNNDAIQNSNTDKLLANLTENNKAVMSLAREQNNIIVGELQNAANEFSEGLQQLRKNQEANHENMLTATQEFARSLEKANKELVSTQNVNYDKLATSIKEAQKVNGDLVNKLAIEQKNSNDAIVGKLSGDFGRLLSQQSLIQNNLAKELAKENQNILTTNSTMKDLARQFGRAAEELKERGLNIIGEKENNGIIKNIKNLKDMFKD